MPEEPEEGVEEQKRCANLRFPITIEPLVLLYTLSVGLNEVIRSNLIMEKICQVTHNWGEILHMLDFRRNFDSQLISVAT